jgi:hypothetical protein
MRFEALFDLQRTVSFICAAQKNMTKELSYKLPARPTMKCIRGKGEGPFRVTESIKSTPAVSKGIEGVVRASEPELLISVDPARQIKSCDQMNLFQKRKKEPLRISELSCKLERRRGCG